MSNKPPLNWGREKDRMRGQQSERPEVREERLRSMAGMRGSPGVALSAWRGRSGTRFVVGVHDIATADPVDLAPAVVIAVHRDEAGRASPVNIVSVESAAGAVAWVRQSQAAGASELHIHRLASSAAARRDVVADLMPVPPPDHRAA